MLGFPPVGVGALLDREGYVLAVDMEHRAVLAGQARAGGGAGGAGAMVPECRSSLLTRWLCDPGGTAADAGQAALRWIAAWWPLLLVGVAAVVVIAVAAAQTRARAQRWAVESAAWWEIRPPARMPADGAAALWRMLLGHLAVGGHGWAPHPRWALGRAGRRVAVEVWAVEGRLRAGVWVPGGVDPQVIGRAVARALPGARLTRATPPGLDEPASTARAVLVREVRPGSGPWTALVDPAPQRGAVRLHAQAATESGQYTLRAVYDALAACPPRYRACWQVVITPHRPRGATGRPVADGLGGMVLVVALEGLRRLVLALLDAVMFMLSPSHTASSGGSRPAAGGAARGPRYGDPYGIDRPYGDRHRVDPVTQARQREADLKRASGPHAVTTIRLAVTGPHESGCARFLDEIAGGYALALPVALNLPRRRRRAGLREVAWRGSRGGLYATAAELAAVWHLPPSPAEYQLPGALARTRAHDAPLPTRAGHGGTWTAPGQRR